MQTQEEMQAELERLRAENENLKKPVQRGAMHPREAVQHLTQAVLQASGGQLGDDATALCLDWHGGPPRDRDATSGANREGRADAGTAAAFGTTGVSDESHS